MVHQGQRLSLLLEAGEDVGRVHAGLDELEGYAALTGTACSAIQTAPMPPSPSFCNNL